MPLSRLAHLQTQIDALAARGLSHLPIQHAQMLVAEMRQLRHDLDRNTASDREQMAQIERTSRRQGAALNERTWVLYALLGCITLVVLRVDLTSQQGAEFANTLLEQATALLPLLIGGGVAVHGVKAIAQKSDPDE